VKTHGLGGSMVWAMDLDDFNGACGLGNNPLMSKLKEVMNVFYFNKIKNA
jgi:GH18 family chitinase